MKIKGYTIKGYMTCFISNQDSKKGRIPTYTSLMEFITSKEEHILLFSSQTTPTNITFNREEHVEHLEQPMEDVPQIPEDSGSITAHSITAEKMMAEKVECNTFKPPHHKLRKDIETKLEELLKEHRSQFAQDETTIWTTTLTKKMINTRDSKPVSQKPFFNCNETLSKG